MRLLKKALFWGVGVMHFLMACACVQRGSTSGFAIVFSEVIFVKLMNCTLIGTGSTFIKGVVTY